MFPPVKINGEVYIDGGYEVRGGDNTPLNPICTHHPNIKIVIVVYLDDRAHIDVIRRAKNRKVADSAGVRLVEIIPSEDIGGAFGFGGVFDTSPDTVLHLIDLGRKDAREALLKAKLISSEKGEG